jgi:hypothetical protein
VKPPEVRRPLPCASCGGSPDHALTTVQGGTAWICSACGAEAKRYTYDDMARMLTSWTAGAELIKPEHVPSIEGVTVFIRTPEGGEGELDRRFLQQHVEITGALPEPGKPLYAQLKGLPPALSAVAYGEVARVTIERGTPLKFRK